MHISEYQRPALRTEKFLPSGIERLEHASLGLITEIGEIATEVKRIAIYGKSLSDIDPKTNLTRAQHIAEEVGDVMWYLAIGMDAINSDVAVLFEMGSPTFTLKQATRQLAVHSGAVAAWVDIVLDDGVPDGYNLSQVFMGIAQALQVVCHHIDIPIEQILSENIAKLQERFPDAYSNEAAEARADKGGLDARNS